MYCVVNDIIEDLTESVVAQLSNDTNPSTINQSIVEKYISQASELINGYLRGRYVLPLINSHSIIKKICIDIVKYELYKRRGKLFEDIQKLYNDAIANLEKIQKGVITLNEGDPKTRPGFFLVSERNPVISKEVIDNY